MDQRIKSKKRVHLFLLSVILCLGLLHVNIFAAERSLTVEDGRYNDSNDTSYLKISLDKNGETFTNTSTNTNTPVVQVLENTKWNLKAEYVVVKDGKISTKNVTKYCSWASEDTTYASVWVSKDPNDGSVYAFSNSGNKSYNVLATYSAYEDVDGEQVFKTHTAKLGFKVKKLSISSGDAEGMRCLTYNQLLMTKWDAIQSYGDSNKTVSDISKDFLDTYKEDYISQSKKKNSATVYHLYSAAAGSSVYHFAWTSTADSSLRALVFSNGTTYYIAYQYLKEHAEDSYAPIFKSALSLYNSVAKSASKIVVTGSGIGGTAASYISYATGSRAITFNSKSGLDYASLNDFENLCKNYSYVNQLGYRTKITDKYSGREPYYLITPQSGNMQIGLNQMITYNSSKETVAFSKKANTSLKSSKNQNVWDRGFYMGGNTEDGYSKTSYRGHVLFGGDGADSLTVNAPDPGGFLIAESLDAGALICKYLPLSDNISDLRDGMVIGIESEMDAKKITKGLGQWALGKIPGVGTVVNATSFMSDFGMYIAKQIYPGNNFFVGGKGNDILRGTSVSDVYVYSKGDGYDKIYDGKNNCVDSIYLLGIKSSEVTVNYDKAADNIVRICVNGEAAIDFYIENSGVAIFFGSPFDNPTSSAVYTKDDLKQISKCFQVECPVDVLVYDGDGNLVQTLKDGTESRVETDYGTFEVAKVDDEYAKSVVLYDDAYDIKICGNADGEMSYSAAYFDEDGSLAQYSILDHINIEKGESFSATDDMSQAILNYDTEDDGSVDGQILYNTEININKDKLSLAYGDTHQLSCSLKTDSAIKAFAWASDNTDVVTVDEDGQLKAIGTGTAMIQAIALDGSDVYDTCEVTVTEKSMTAENFTVSGLKNAYEYTGEELPISISVSFGCIELEDGVDYVSSFSELTEPGEATLTIEGIGQYSGKKVLTYEINEPKEAQTVEEMVQKAANLCRNEELSGEYETALWLHDWLVDYANYDYTYTYYYADGVLLHKTGVCNSYALAYAALLDEFNIENEVLVSPEMNHAWNLAELDGEWCHIDCTWDDPGNGGAENHDYFGLNDALISRDHKWDTSAYRTCTSLQNHYYTREGYHIFENKDTLTEVLNKISADQEETVKLCYTGTDSDFNLFDAISEYVSKYNWKYGITTYGLSGNYYNAEYSPIYGATWDEPKEFTGVADCPYFALRGPKGMYRLSDYKDNGMILIFGRESCFNTRGLLDKLYASLSDLRSAGVEVVVNAIDAENPEDFGYLEENYPDFVYTYGDYTLLNSLEETIDASYNTFPIVFFINKNERITYSSGGYVSDIDGFIEKALDIETNSPLPEPSEDGSDYTGAYYNYTGKKTESMVSAIQDQLKGKRSVLWAYDSLYESDPSSLDSMLKAISEIAEECKTYECDYTVEEGTYYFQPGGHLFGVPVTYDTHTVVNIKAVEPTCTEKGCTAGSYCKVCGKVFKESQEISALGHNVTLIKGTEPTCKKEGTEDCYYCNDCGKYFNDDGGKEEITAPGTIAKRHMPGTRHKKVAATCTETGTIGYYDCTGCECKLDKNGNVLDDLTIPIDSSNHAGKTEIRDAVAASCDKEGYTGDMYCTSCGELISKGTSIAKSEKHTYDEGIVSIEATDDTEGEIVYTCRICGESKTEIIPNLNHVHEIGPLHEALAATCESYGTIAYYDCTGCNRKLDADGNEIVDVLTDKDPLNHVGETKLVNALDASCKRNGYSGDLYCESCGCLIECGTQITRPDHVLGMHHEETAATCDCEGSVEYWDCTGCDQKLDADGKVVENITRRIDPTNHEGTIKTSIKKATTSKAGLITDTCSACGKIMKTTEIAYPKKFTLSANSYSYDGKVKTPALKIFDSKGKTIASSNYSVSYSAGRKAVGKYSCSITFKGSYYSGSKGLSFTIVPKKASIKSLTSGKKSLTVKASAKASSLAGTGYQIAYRVSGTSKWSYTTMTAVSKKISGLKKGKKYQIGIRAYKKTGKITLYGSWSSYKTSAKVK